MQPLLECGVDKRVIDVLGFDNEYNYGIATIQAVPLVHNVSNCGYKIRMNGERIFYATDTGTLDGIKAKNYDYYLIEANHTQEEIEARIAEKKANELYAYEYNAARNHLSREQAMDWLSENMGANSRYAFLHQHIEK